MADGFSVTPDRYRIRVEQMFADLGVEPARACAACRALVEDMEHLQEAATACR